MQRYEFDADGQRWVVYEVPAPTDGRVDPGMRAGWLFFESATDHRRLYPIPDEWKTGHFDAVTLLRRAKPVRRKFL